MWALYINNGGRKNNFIDGIFNRRKTMETRTRRSSQAIDRDISIGDRVAIISRSHVVGVVAFTERVDMATRRDFTRRYRQHRVRTFDPRYGCPKAGKVGYCLEVLADLRGEPIPVPKMNHPASHTYISINI